MLLVTYIKIFVESFKQAIDSLWGNKLRTFLSLLGITIGIFCIIAVKSAVDSLQKNIVDGFKELGNDVIYIEKQPWNEDPNQNFWKYKTRPDPSYSDFQAIQEKAKKVKHVAYVIFNGGRVAKFKNSSVSNTLIVGATYDYATIQNLNIELGRGLTQSEYNSASNKIIIGHKVSEALFGNIDPIGRHIKLYGQDFQVIGKLKAEGDNMFNFINFDDALWMGYPTISKFVNTSEESNVGKMLCVKAKDGVDMNDFKGEVTGIVRAKRKLSPRSDDNFSLNEISMLAGVIEGIFGVLNLAGFIIGIFSLIVGMFSVANIMFVSVKERTGIIGIKKAIGAKSFVVLLEFLIESVILCLIGGLMGLILVFGILKAIVLISGFEMELSAFNVILGVSVSVIVGIIAGIIPAIKASRMDPVEAIRS
jgi:putative ABC transport system permease protein